MINSASSTRMTRKEPMLEEAFSLCDGLAVSNTYETLQTKLRQIIIRTTTDTFSIGAYVELWWCTTLRAVLAILHLFMSIAARGQTCCSLL